MFDEITILVWGFKTDKDIPASLGLEGIILLIFDVDRCGHFHLDNWQIRHGSRWKQDLQLSWYGSEMEVKLIFELL